MYRILIDEQDGIKYFLELEHTSKAWRWNCIAYTRVINELRGGCMGTVAWVGSI